MHIANTNKIVINWIFILSCIIMCNDFDLKLYMFSLFLSLYKINMFIIKKFLKLKITRENKIIGYTIN